MLFYILDTTYTVKGTLTTKGTTNKVTPFFNVEFAMDLTSGAMTLTGDTFVHTFQSPYLVTGNYIAFEYENEYKLFQICEVTQAHTTSHTKSIYCEMAGIQLINSPIRPTSIASLNISQAMVFALQDTDYEVGYIDSSITDVLSLEITEPISVYEFIQQYIIGEFGAEIKYRVEMNKGKVAGKYIDVYSRIGKFEGFRFEYSRSITSIKRTEDSTSLVTALIPTGKNGTDIKSVSEADKPEGQDWIGNEEAYKRYSRDGRHIFGTFKYDTESPQELYLEAKKELESRSEPKIKYEVDVELLGRDVGLGDTVFVIDNEFEPALHLSARVSQKKVYFDDRSKDKVILSNFVEVASNIQRDVEGMIDGRFPIGTSDIQDSAITSDKVSSGAINSLHIQADSIETRHIQSETIETRHLQADSITTKQLQADSVTTKQLQADSVTAQKIQADSISTDHLQANSVTADKILANSITSDKIEAEAITADKIQAGTITADQISSSTITADKIATGTIVAGSGVIADGAIGNAQISSIDAGKISAGTIDTSKVTVQGANGNLKIKGNRLQVFTGTGTGQYERVSLGDVNGDGTVYGFRVRGADGKTVLMDETGVKQEGITDGSITNSKISDNAKIDGAKLNINSVVTEINKDGTEVINGTKIEVEGTNLVTKLSTITNTQSSQGQSISQAFSEIKANTDSIKLKVDEQTYTTDKQATTQTLEKHTSEISAMKDSIDLKVDATEVTKISDKLNSVETRVSSAELKITPKAIVNSVSQGIKEGTALSTTSTVLDSNGFTVNNGALTVKNNTGTKVLYGDTSGNLTLAGNITSNATITGGSLKSLNGALNFNLNSGYMLLYNDGVKVGQTQKNNIVGTSIYGVTNGAEYGSYASLGAKKSSSDTTYTTMLAVTGSSLASYLNNGVNLGANLNCNSWNIESPNLINNPTTIKWLNTAGQESAIYGTSSDNSLIMRCSDNNEVIIACKHSVDGVTRIADFTYSTANKDGIDFWRNLNMHNYKITNASTLSVESLSATDIELVDPVATYSRTGESIKYTVPRALTPNVEYFGTAKVIDGECSIALPEGMDGTLNYIVILTPIGKNEVWLEEKGEDSFLVKGTDCTFDYLIKCNNPQIATYSKTVEGEVPPTVDEWELKEGTEILTEG